MRISNSSTGHPAERDGLCHKNRPAEALTIVQLQFFAAWHVRPAVRGGHAVYVFNMRAVIQRVLSARVTVDGKVTGEIARGLVVLLGVEAGDAERDLAFMADKIAALRIFEDDAGKMNRSVREVEGAVLLVSQFTLLGDCRKGMRPSFDRAERPERARQVYEEMIAALRARGVPVETGVFQAMMQVELVNDGPVTVVVDSRG